MTALSEQSFLLPNPTIAQHCWATIRAFQGDGSLYEVIVRPYERNRTLQQNRRYWLLVKVIASHTGNDPQYLHEYLKCRFLGMVAVWVNKQMFEVPRSTTTLGVKPFAEYMLQVEAWAATELGIGIPAPGWYGYGSARMEQQRRIAA